MRKNQKYHTWVQKLSIFSNLVIIRITLNNSKEPLLNACDKVKLQKRPMKTFTGEFQTIDFEPKNIPSTTSWALQKFSLETWTLSLSCVYSTLTSCKKLKKVNSQFWENGVTYRQMDRQRQSLKHEPFARNQASKIDNFWSVMIIFFHIKTRGVLRNLSNICEEAFCEKR